MIALLLFAATMSLSPAQQATLKADIVANFSCAQVNQTVADAYNATASPDFWVWRTRVTKDEFVNTVSVDGTTFDWTGAGFITRSQGERDAFQQMFMSGGSAVNPSLTNVRQAFTDIFSGGTAPAPANRTHFATIGRRKATRAEALFSTGTGSTVSPGILGWESPAGGLGSILTAQDVSGACNLP